MIHVQRINSLEQLQPYQQQWDALAGDCVFRSWAWLTTWWGHYGAAQSECELAVFLVFDNPASSSCQSKNESCQCSAPGSEDNLIAILPCYMQQNFSQGIALRLLGDGEVCSDHLDLLVDKRNALQAASSLADYLVRHAEKWDVADFIAIEEKAIRLNNLVTELKARNCHVTRVLGQSRWSVELPATWEEFLSLQSKSHRKQLRRLDSRVLNTDQATWHLVKTPTEFELAWEILVDLHQRRRISLGEPGCFASKRWADFHRDVAQQLLSAGRLRLSWLELAGQPIAAEYHFADQSSTLAYQGGLDPNRLDEEPGRLSMIRAIQHAIEESHTTFDLLRGDEPYKAHWRATPHPTHDLQIVSPRSAARFRHQLRRTLKQVGRVARQVTNLLS